MAGKIAYLGLGIMGSAMAVNLARAGHDVSGWNRTPGKPGALEAAAAGVAIKETAQDAVLDADIVFMCLGDEHDLDSLLFGQTRLVDSIKQHAVLIDMSTSGPRAAKTISEELGKAGIRFLDAPVSGGDVGARNATLTIMVGGSRQDFDACQLVFRCLGKNIHYCGPTGSGQGVKLCNQILCAVNMVAVCEAFELAESLELDPQMIVDVCSTGAAGSWALANLGPRIARSDFAPAFMIKHMQKDLRLVREANPELEGKLPGTQLADSQFEKAKSLAGTAGGEQGTQAMMRAYRKL